MCVCVYTDLLTPYGRGSRFFSNVQPYIPIIGAAYFGSIEPTQLLLSAMYGVAARLPGAIVSTRDFLHIKRVFEHQLKSQMTHYKPSLQACQALTLIHLTLEMQCEGLEGVETWPLRLSAVLNIPPPPQTGPVFFLTAANLCPPLRCFCRLSAWHSSCDCTGRKHTPMSRRCCRRPNDACSGPFSARIGGNYITEPPSLTHPPPPLTPPTKD